MNSLLTRLYEIESSLKLAIDSKDQLTIATVGTKSFRELEEIKPLVDDIVKNYKKTVELLREAQKSV